MGSPLHLTEVREAESRMALIFLKTVTLTGRATQAPPEDRSSAHVGNLDCQKLDGGDLNLSPAGNKSRRFPSEDSGFRPGKPRIGPGRQAPRGRFPLQRPPRQPFWPFYSHTAIHAGSKKNEHRYDGAVTGRASHTCSQRQPLRQPNFGNRVQFSDFVGVL